MKKILFLLLFLISTTGLTYAEIGYVDYSVIYKNLPASKQYQEKIDAKVQQLRTYNKETQTQLASKTTAQERANFKKARKEGAIKIEREYIDLRGKQEALVKSKVKAAAKTVLTQKNLEMIVNSKYRVAGGIDCTQEILKAIK